MYRQAIFLLAIFLLAGISQSHADLITGPSQIVATTDINFNGGFGSIDQIADGIDLNTDGPPYNGYGPNATSGVITLTLQGGTYTLNDFLLANDINVGHEGVDEFQLSFYDVNNQLISTTPVLTAAAGEVPAQTFDLGTVTGVKRVDFNVISVYTSTPTRIEVREVALQGVLETPEPSGISLAALGFTVLLLAGLRRKKT